VTHVCSLCCLLTTYSLWLLVGLRASVERFVIRRNCSCGASNSAYSYTFLRRLVYHLSVCHIKPSDGLACHLAGTLVGSSDTLCQMWSLALQEGEIWCQTPAKTCSCELLLPPGEYKGRDTAYCQITLVLVVLFTDVTSMACCYHCG